MTTFYISRHGQTENNKHQRMSGWIDTPLTPAGIENAESSATKLRDIHLDKIISSDLGRAFATAYIIARGIGFATEIERTPELREVNYGDLANMKIEDIIASGYPLNMAEYVPPNGESLGHMQQRVLAFLGKTALENPGASILLVAHDGTINAIYAAASDISVSEADERRNAHDFVACFKVDAGKITDFEEVV
jgi:probable phosphoglycerate mutase